MRYRGTRLKAIVSLRVNGKWAEVGMSHRTIVEGSTRGIIKKARTVAKGQPFRMEVFRPDNFYGDPIWVREFES